MTKEKRNRLIYERHKEGISQKEIGRLYGLSQSAISEILIACRKGVFSLEKETRGAKPRLKQTDKEQLSKFLKEKKATDYGFPAEIWDKWTVQALVKKEFGVSYHENYIWKIMADIGFSSQKPVKKDYRQDPEKVKEFKAKKAGYIKKG